MAKVYFTSDLHFGHKNLCEGLRGMTSEESDKLIIDNWNSVVTKRDKVYVLGDITMERPHDIYTLTQLRGDIVVVGGNHDIHQCCKKLNKIGIVVMGALEYKGYICTHIPIHPLEMERFKGNIHGHIHKDGIIDGWKYEGIKDLGDGYLNVNTELHNYTPIEFNKLIEYYGSK